MTYRSIDDNKQKDATQQSIIELLCLVIDVLC